MYLTNEKCKYAKQTSQIQKMLQKPEARKKKSHPHPYTHTQNEKGCLHHQQV